MDPRNRSVAMIFGSISNQKRQKSRMKYGHESTLGLTLWLLGRKTSTVCAVFSSWIYLFVSTTYFLMAQTLNILVIFLN